MLVNNVVAIVTGGASGLGEATIRRIVNNGGKATILDVSKENGLSLVEELGYEQVLYVKGDVTNEVEVQNALNKTIEKFGPLNTVVNCAGISIGEKIISKGKVHSFDRFKKVIEVNLIGTFNVIRLAAEKMVTNERNTEGEKGVIINTASIAAYEGQLGQVAYSASKGGIVGMTLPLARDLAREGIRVMSIAPGLIDTPLFEGLPEPARQALSATVPFPPRLGYPSEYAQLVKSIIENPLLNGETIRLDGAVRMQPK